MGLKNPFANRPMKPSNGDAEHYQWDDDAAADDLAAKLAAVGENDDGIELESDEAEHREAVAAKIPVLPKMPTAEKLVGATPDAVKALRERMASKKAEASAQPATKPVTEVSVDQAAVRVAQIVMDPAYHCWVDGRVLRAVKIADGHITQVEIEFARMSQRTSKLIG